MELSSLKFAVDTTELDRAGRTIGELASNIGKIDKSAREAAKTEEILAKAAKANADANLSNAKAQDVRLKSTIAADKADKAATSSVENKTKAENKAIETTTRHVDILQKQKDILEFQTQGFSKGQSTILAYGKAAGLAVNDIEELGKVLETQRKLMGGDPFDKSLSGLKSLQNQYTELKESVRQYATDSNLSAKQTRELARDKERLIEKMKVEGASFSDIRKAVRAHNEEYVNLATSYNKMTSAEDAVIKGRKEAVNATNYLAQADAKMAAALNTSNAALDKAGTDSLVKYETALRKSGVSQDVATAKLATYKAQLTQVAGLEEKRRAQHLARALQPQFTDIAVSLYSGQAPLTVLLQQSGQILDIFKLSGIEADNLGKVMREAFASMIPAIATVAKGLTSLVFESFMSAGSAVTRFVGNVTGITAAMEIAKRAIVSGGEANFKYIASLDKIGKTFSAVAATGIAAVIAGMILLGLEYKKIIQAEAELTNALATSGGALGISKTEAIAAAEGMASLGVGTLKAVAAITEIAKAGNIGKESLELITKSAIDLEKTAGISIEETAKQFAKLQEEPAKALTEIAQKTGLVDKATLDYVYALEQQGDKTEAARVATLALASANAQVAAEVRDNWSPIEVLWNDIKSAIGSVKQEIYDLTTSNAVVGALRTVWETVAVVISEVWFTIKGVGKEIGGIGAQIAAVMQGDFSGAAEIGRMMKADAASAAEEQKKYVEAILNRTSVEQQSFNQSKEQNSQYAKWRRENDQALDKSISKTDKYKAKELEMQKAVLAGTVSQTEADKALAGWKKIIFGEEKTKKDPSENYYATLMREATASSIKAEDATKSLTASQVKLLETVNDPRFLKLSKVQQETYLSTMAANVATEQQTALTEKLAEAEEHRLKLLGKSEGIGKQYYSDMQKLEEFAKVAGWSREQIEELTRAIFMATPAWKDYEKALEDVNSAARKFNEDSIASQAATLKENESLDYRISLLGKTTEEQKALSAEYNRANKIADVRIKLAKQLRDIEAKIENAKKKGLPESEYKALIDDQVQARKDAAEQEKVINREVAVQYAEDLQKEIDAIKNGISDSIVTALFEGGKAGSKKIRDLVVAELRKPVTMVVNAVVNTVLGNIVGSLMGGAAAGAAGGAAGGIAGSIGSSIAGSAIMSGIGMMGTEGLANIVGFLGGDALGVLGAGASGGFSSAIASAIGQIPVWGWAVGGLAAIASMFDDSGTPHMGAGAIYKDGQLREGKDLYGSGVFNMGHRDEYNVNAQAAVSGIASGIGRALDTFATSFGKKAGYEVATAFADDSSDGGAWGSLRISKDGKNILNWRDTQTSRWAPKEFGDGEEGYKQYLAAIAKDTRKVLMDMDLPSWANKILSDLGESPSIESLTSAITQIGNINTVFENLKSTFVQLSSATDSTLESLMNLSGGIDSLANSASSYYNNFYSNTEKATKLQNDLTKSLALYNLALPETKDAYRALVEAQDVATESGAKAYVALLQNSAMFSELTAMQAALAETMKSLKEETSSLEIELLRLQGRTAEADAKQRAIDTAGMSEAEIAVYDYNTALRAQIKALEDAAESVEKLSSSIVDEINRLRGYTDTSGNNPKALIAEFDRLTTLARGGDANAFNSLGDTSKLLDEYYKNTATSAVQYAYQRSVLANSLEQSYNTAKAGGATFSGTSSLMGTPTLSTPVVSSVSSANAAGSSGLADLLSAVVTELTMLRAEVRADVAHNAKTAKILERVTPEGDALATRNEG